MPRYDLGSRPRSSAPESSETVYIRRDGRTPRQQKKELGKRILWTVGAAFLGYGVWRFMESRREKPPVECVTVNEVEDYDDE